MLLPASVALFVVSVVAHNALSALLRTEEPIFFLLAVLVAPVLLIVGLVGSLVLLAGRLWAARRR